MGGGSMELGDLAHGREAAEIFGAARVDEVWRAVARHGDVYPGELKVYTFGRKKAVPRTQLRDFTTWYRVGRSVNTRPNAPRPHRGRPRDGLREAIRRIESKKGAT